MINYPPLSATDTPNWRTYARRVYIRQRPSQRATVERRGQKYARRGPSGEEYKVGVVKNIPAVHPTFSQRFE